MGLIVQGIFCRVLRFYLSPGLFYSRERLGLRQKTADVLFKAIDGEPCRPAVGLSFKIDLVNIFRVFVFHELKNNPGCRQRFNMLKQPGLLPDYPVKLSRRKLSRYGCQRRAPGVSARLKIWPNCFCSAQTGQTTSGVVGESILYSAHSFTFITEHV